MARNTFSFAIAAICMMAAPAMAADTRLAWRDLDLTTPAGKAELERRIDTASRQVCAPQAVTGSLIVRRDPSADCLAEAHRLIAEQVAARVERNRLARSNTHGSAGGEAAR